jgi:hypothetical protein
LSCQPEAHCFSASCAWREHIACLHQNSMRLSMLAVNHLINAALDAECARKKIVSRTDAFHKDLQLETCRREEAARVCGNKQLKFR